MVSPPKSLNPSPVESTPFLWRYSQPFSSAPLLRPCLESTTQDPPVDGVFLDLGSALMALLFGAKDLGLGARVHFSAKLNATYREAPGQRDRRVAPAFGVVSPKPFGGCKGSPFVLNSALLVELNQKPKGRPSIFGVR